jgi:hypothetical protein
MIIDIMPDQLQNVGEGYSYCLLCRLLAAYPAG